MTGIIYRPPSAGTDYYTGILNQLDFIHDNYDKVVLMGDLNYNYKCNATNPVNNIESLYGMKQLVTNPTRVTLTTSTLLDVVLSNVPELHCITDVYTIAVSDHYLVYTVLMFAVNKPDAQNVTFRNYKNLQLNEFLNELSNCTYITDTEWCAGVLEDK